MPLRESGEQIVMATHLTLAVAAANMVSTIALRDEPALTKEHTR